MKIAKKKFDSLIVKFFVQNFCLISRFSLYYFSHAHIKDGNVKKETKLTIEALLKKAEKVEDEAEDPPLVSLIRTK